MNPEEQVRSALKALAEHDQGLESITSAEAIFAKHRVVRPAFQRRWMWLGAVAAAAVAAIAAWSYQPVPRQKFRIYVEAPRAEVEESKGEAAPKAAPETTKVAAVSQERPPAPKPVRRKRPIRQTPEPPPQEVVTDFFPLMDAPPPFERGQLVRMVVPAATMRSVGLPISPERWNDRVQADVLVGEEGMARAIRFVSFTQ